MAINWHVFLLMKIIRPHVIQTCRMIFVLMSEDDRINCLNMVLKHLLTKIWSAVDNKAFTLYGDMNRAPASFIPVIQRPAYPAVAPYDRYALRSSGAKKSNSQISNDVCESSWYSFLFFSVKEEVLRSTLLIISRRQLILPSIA